MNESIWHGWNVQDKIAGISMVFENYYTANRNVHDYATR